jgi:hypothetical protein
MKSFNEFLNEKSYKDTFRVKKDEKFLTVGWKMGKVSFTSNKQTSYPFQDEKSAEKAAKEYGGEVFSYSEIFEDLKTKEIDPSKFSNDGPKKDTEYFKKGKKDGDFNDDVIETKRFSIPAKSLKPSQDAIYLSKALDMAINNIVGGDLNAMVSRDNYILDGHHRWAATMFGNPNAKVQGMQSNLTIGDLVPVLRKAGDALGNERGVEPKGGDTNIYKATIQDIEDAVYTGKNMNKKYYNKDASIAWYETLGKDLVEKRLKAIQSKKLPAGAPARKDMPKIEPEQVAKIASDLNGGKIDAMFPYVKEQKSNRTMKALNEFLNEKKSNIQTGDVVKWKKGYADSKAEAAKVYDVLSDPDSFGFVKIRDRNSKITGTIESAKINFLEKIESLGQEEFDRLKELEKEIDDIKKGKKEGKIIPLDRERKTLLRKLKTGTSSYIHKHGPNKGNPIQK